MSLVRGIKHRPLDVKQIHFIIERINRHFSSQVHCIIAYLDIDSNMYIRGGGYVSCWQIRFEFCISLTN